MLRLSLRFFDAGALVGCESARLALALERLYGAGADPGPAPAEYRVGSAVDARWPGEHEWTRLAPPGTPEALAHALLFSSLAGRVRSHWLLHAAALVGPAGGILLAGESGSGKTTLALALAQRGCAWLSDEVAAVERATGLLCPFPRAALVRPATLRLLPGIAGRTQPWPLPDSDAVACWRPTAPADPAPIRSVFLLTPGAPQGPMEVAIGGFSDALGAAVAGEPALESASLSHTSGGTVVLSWPGVLSARALARLDALCRAHGGVLLNVRSRAAAPAFDAAPALSPCAPSEAWLELASAAWNRPAPSSESGLSLLQELAAALAHAACYRLRPGLPAETAALIEQAAGADAPALPAERGQACIPSGTDLPLLPS